MEIFLLIILVFFALRYIFSNGLGAGCFIVMGIALTCAVAAVYAFILWLGAAL